MTIDEALAVRMICAPGDGQGPAALHVLADEVERLSAVLAELHSAGPTVGALLAELALARERLPRLEAIEARVIEWSRDTDLTHPSASETAIHDAMRDVLDGDPS